MRPKFKTLFAIASFAVIFSCNEEERTKPISNSIGYISEINITSDLETYQYLKTSLQSNLAEPQAYLSPAEPFYRINYIGINNYAGSYPEYQLQFIVITQDNVEELKSINSAFRKNEFDSLVMLPKVTLIKKQDIWAKNQSIFFIFGPSAESIRLYMNENKANIRAQLYASEVVDFINRSGNKNHPLSKILSEKYGIGLSIPDYFDLDIQENDYYSANWEEGDANCNLLIKILPASTDTAPYLKETVIEQREKDGKQYLPMDSTGVLYLGTSKVFPQTYSKFSLNGYNGSKINGWWVIEGLFRGGPYTRYTVFHKPSGRWIALEGLVYYPNLEQSNSGKSKTRYLRTMEAIINSLK